MEDLSRLVSAGGNSIKFANQYRWGVSEYIVVRLCAGTGQGGRPIIILCPNALYGDCGHRSAEDSGDRGGAFFFAEKRPRQFDSTTALGNVTERVGNI